MKAKPRILVTGSRGQLGHECWLTTPDAVDATFVDLPDFDLSKPESLLQVVQQVRPEITLHLGAWTAVDDAERHEAAATAINGEATSLLAESIQSVQGRLVFVSTDYVFQGRSTHLLGVDAAPQPINAYGRSKLHGEQAAREILGNRAHIVRTSWLWGRKGANFPRTMLKGFLSHKQLKVVDDQRGCPTWAGGLARALWAVALTHDAPSLMHYCDSGVTTWFGFAQAIHQEALRLGWDVGPPPTPCSRDEFPTPAPRPTHSALEFSSSWSALGLRPNSWQEQLAEHLNLLVEDFQKSEHPGQESLA